MLIDECLRCHRIYCFLFIFSFPGGGVDLFVYLILQYSYYFTWRYWFTSDAIFSGQAYNKKAPKCYGFFPTSTRVPFCKDKILNQDLFCLAALVSPSPLPHHPAPAVWYCSIHKSYEGGDLSLNRLRTTALSSYLEAYPTKRIRLNVMCIDQPPKMQFWWAQTICQSLSNTANSFNFKKPPEKCKHSVFGIS